MLYRVYSIKALVATYMGLSFHVYANDHNPPHFHVKGQNCDASFRISDGSLLKGKMGRGESLVQLWYKDLGGKELVGRITTIQQAYAEIKDKINGLLTV